MTTNPDLVVDAVRILAKLSEGAFLVWQGVGAGY
jgi:hypothetical protein